eukprot:COSAG05_NODE_2061_length_3624_cov_5.109787_2_plen_220_part_00
MLWHGATKLSDRYFGMRQWTVAGDYHAWCAHIIYVFGQSTQVCPSLKSQVSSLKSHQVCLILSNQRFSALGMNMQSKPLGRSSALPACSAAVVRGFPLSSYGLVSVPGMWWRSVGVLCREVVWKGGGAGFEPMTCSVEVLRFRASHQCCTEATSEVGCNSSPILLGKLLDITKLLCFECKFSDLGITVVLGRLESLDCPNLKSQVSSIWLYFFHFFFIS